MIDALIAAGANLAGGLISGRSARKNAAMNVAAQKDFAQHGIQWKVKDAEAAGLHPLAALGVSTNAFSPVNFVGDMGPTVSQMGQDISRAVRAGQSAEQRDVMGEFMKVQLAAQAQRDAQSHAERMREYDVRLAEQRLELGRLQLSSQIEGQGSRAGGSLPPPVPAVGAVKVEPAKVTSRAPGAPDREAGVGPAHKRYEVAPGWYVDMPGEVFGESLENSGVLGQLLGSGYYALRNLGYLKDQATWKLWGNPEEKYGPAPKGKKWVFDLITKSWSLQPWWKR